MRYREFFDFIDGGGENVILRWLNGLPVAARAQIQAHIRMLEKVQIPSRRDMKKLMGYRDLIELRITFMKVQYRPIGFAGPAARQFTILAGATERDSAFAPPDVCKTALKRLAIVRGDPTRRTRVHEE
jgi:Phage derived protein Gp49-like (DUF891)